MKTTLKLLPEFDYEFDFDPEMERNRSELEIEINKNREISGALIKVVGKLMECQDIFANKFFTIYGAEGEAKAGGMPFCNKESWLLHDEEIFQYQCILSETLSKYVKLEKERIGIFNSDKEESCTERGSVMKPPVCGDGLQDALNEERAGMERETSKAINAFKEILDKISYLARQQVIANNEINRGDPIASSLGLWASTIQKDLSTLEYFLKRFYETYD